MLKTLFNPSAVIALALAGGLGIGTAGAQTPAPQPMQTDIQADVMIGPGSNSAVVYSRPVKSLQACYNYAVTIMATTNSDTAIVACSNSDGQLLSSASCDFSGSWGYYKKHCHDTTEQSRTLLFPLTPEALQKGPVSSPTFSN